MSDKLNTLEGLRLASLKAKGYTAEQIAALAETLQGIIEDINTSLATCEAHVESAHAPADAEPNVIVSIQRNGKAVAPKDKVVNILVPVKLSELTQDMDYTTATELAQAIANSGHLSVAVVDALPAVADADANTLYFLRKTSGGETGNMYDEYKLVNGAFELIGGGKVDLDPYATTESVEKASAALITSIFNTLEASDEKYVGTGNLSTFWGLVKPLITANTQSATDLAARVELLELILKADVTGNPFYVTFGTLDGVSAVGVWNTHDARIEFWQEGVMSHACTAE